MVAAGLAVEAAKKYVKSEDKKAWGIKIKRDVFYYEKDGEQFADSVVYHITHGDKILYHGDPTATISENDKPCRGQAVWNDVLKVSLDTMWSYPVVVDTIDQVDKDGLQ